MKAYREVLLCLCVCLCVYFLMCGSSCAYFVTRAPSPHTLSHTHAHTHTHTHHTELLRCPTCHPHPGERKTKRKREGMIERETGRWRDGDEGGACSACLDVNNAPEGSAANCQLLIFVVSFNHLRLCFPPPSPFTNSYSPSSSLHLTPPTPPPHSTPLAMQRST